MSCCRKRLLNRIKRWRSRTAPRQHERKWRRTSLAVRWKIFQHQKLHLKDPIDANKASYFNSKTSQCVGDQKTLFKIVNAILHIQLSSYSSATGLVEIFNQFFLTTIERIWHEIDREIVDGQSLIMTAEPLLHSFWPATCEEILKLIRKSSSSACCLDL